MKIESFSTRVVTMRPEQGAWSDAPPQVSRDFVTLELRAGGLRGIGYAGFASPLMTKALKEAVDALAVHAVGEDPLAAEAVGAKLLELGGSGAPAGLATRAVSAIDVALWDLKGKACGQPVYKLLGGFRDRVPAYASGYLWRDYSPGELAAKGAELAEEGFLAMKFRMGALGDEDEIERMDELREAVGPDIQLMVDINQGWDVNRAVLMGREMEASNIYWLEDPVHHQDFDGLARIADQLDTAVCTGEYLYGVAPFRYLLDRGAADIVMIDLLRAGGLTQWMKIAHLAESHNLPVVSHLATEVLAHAVAAVPNGLWVEHMPWSFPLFEEVPELDDGELRLAQKPGLGLEFTKHAAPAERR